MIKRMSNKSPGFYGYMGKIFGSRKVQRDTGDRFYDDDVKEWIIDIQKKNVMSAVSIKNFVIKNVYADDVSSLIGVLECVYPEVITGTVPVIYREAYISAGYTVTGEKKNFLIVKGGKEQ